MNHNITELARRIVEDATHKGRDQAAQIEDRLAASQARLDELKALHAAFHQAVRDLFQCVATTLGINSKDHGRYHELQARPKGEEDLYFTCSINRVGGSYNSLGQINEWDARCYYPESIKDIRIELSVVWNRVSSPQKEVLLHERDLRIDRYEVVCSMLSEWIAAVSAADKLRDASH